MERHPELTVKMVREVCDGKGSYATYSDAGKLFTIATIVGANSGWEGEEQRRVWADEPALCTSVAYEQHDDPCRPPSPPAARCSLHEGHEGDHTGRSIPHGRPVTWTETATR